MIDGRRVLALVPARGGSKGLPRKNLLPLAGKPLLAWTIDAALRAPSVDSVVLSTDDDELAEAGRAAGCDVPFLRPAHLATDEALAIDVALHALDALEPHDVLVLLQPTSPLRTVDDIEGALALFSSTGAPSCVSVVASPVSPHWMFERAPGGGLAPLFPPDARPARRQDATASFVVLNGAVYVSDVTELRARRAFVTERTVGYAMPPERSIDIDDAEDFARAAEALAATRGAPSR